MMLVEGAVIPTVTDYSMLRGQGAGQVGRLSRAGEGGHYRLDQDRLTRGLFGEGPKAGRMLAQMSIA